MKTPYLLIICFLFIVDLTYGQNEIILTRIDVIEVKEAFASKPYYGRVYTKYRKKERGVFIGYKYSLLLEIKIEPDEYYFSREILITTEFPSGKLNKTIINRKQNLLSGGNYYQFVINFTTKEIGWFNISLAEWSSFVDRIVETSDINFIGNSVYLN